MHIVLIRHCTRIDKSKQGISPGQSEVSLHAGDKNDNNSRDDDYDESSNWLSNFDPPLNEDIASLEMESAFKKISNDILSKNRTKQIMIHSSPYNRCIQTSELLLDKIIHGKQNDGEKINTKLRVDQALSEWLNENYNLKYLPPNDDGYSMINNVNAYLNQPSLSANNGAFTEKTKNQLRKVKDSTWSYNQLGHCGEYGESASAVHNDHTEHTEAAWITEAERRQGRADEEKKKHDQHWRQGEGRQRGQPDRVVEADAVFTSVVSLEQRHERGEGD
ncbi:hypothetical protein PMKS-000509 [Pichia membranifaciens]|uniref:Phosphoglycerate mutase-like protein n=1 Tax=Pichia membranifaciens TaxID=4926 RepID=A0A1Q2YC20_9ASCO|nr:hypothetical protein PMKS-000509 [Pichia membranifaciens]